MGHDAVIFAFIEKVLSKKYPDAFYAVTAAIGPKLDIFFYDENSKTYIAASSCSNGHYIPEFSYRVKISKEDMNAINSVEDYQKQDWYKNLSAGLKTDLKEFLSKRVRKLEKRMRGDLPDIVGFSNDGKLLLFAEVKFEGFSTGAKEAVIKESKIASKLSIPYFLVLPKNPVYARGMSKAWIGRNVPKKVKSYYFVIPKEIVIPKQEDINFKKV